MDERRRLTVYGVTHVLFIVQLPRVAGGTAFTSFQGGPWTSIHIDELTCPTGANQVVKYALSEPLHQFVNMLVEKDEEIPSEFKVCTRIKDNIQLAVSRIVSAHTYKQMERVIDILLELMPDKAPTELGKAMLMLKLITLLYINIFYISDSDTFIGCLVIRLKHLLEQRDESIPNPEKWAVDTALNRHQLQANFTLVNSIRKLMDVQIQRILSYIVSRIDKNSNLDLLRGDNNPCIKKFWLSLFNNITFLQFDYNAIVTSSVPVTNVKGQIYCCKFPFSWELIDQIEAVVGNVIHMSGLSRGIQTSYKMCYYFISGDKMKTFADFVSAASDLTFYESIQAVPPEYSQQFYEYYLYDYVRNLSLPFNEAQLDNVYEVRKL